VQREGFEKAVAAGVKLAFGTDSGTYPHGMNARQFASMVKHGMTPMEAIRSATVVAAELMGWRDRVGALEPGLFADVLAVEGDVLSDVDRLTDAALVMRGGRVLSAG
jgi:imidazolonepropionase-like amidohydrolase